VAGSLAAVARGTVKSFNDEEGWGVLASDEGPVDMWVHFSHVEGRGYRELRAGQHVDVDWEQYPPGRDRYVYRARRVRPLSLGVPEAAVAPLPLRVGRRLVSINGPPLTYAVRM
jgi:cold shock CspA family protein